jgi:hypothetical protein
MFTFMGSRRAMWVVTPRIRMPQECAGGWFAKKRWRDDQRRRSFEAARRASNHRELHDSRVTAGETAVGTSVHVPEVATRKVRKGKGEGRLHRPKDPATRTVKARLERIAKRVRDAEDNKRRIRMRKLLNWVLVTEALDHLENETPLPTYEATVANYRGKVQLPWVEGVIQRIKEARRLARENARLVAMRNQAASQLSSQQNQTAQGSSGQRGGGRRGSAKTGRSKAPPKPAEPPKAREHQWTRVAQTLVQPDGTITYSSFCERNECPFQLIVTSADGRMLNRGDPLPLLWDRVRKQPKPRDMNCRGT